MDSKASDITVITIGIEIGKTRTHSMLRQQGPHTRRQHPLGIFPCASLR
jgi:hypothetical protein